jgi:hypothetical protein
MTHRPGPPAPDRLSRLGQLEAWLLPLASNLIPRVKRDDWVKEWQAEFWYLRHGQSRNRRRGDRLLEILSLARGLLADAAWIGVNSLRERKRGSAQSCLVQLAQSCLACGVFELVYEGSWRLLMGTFAHYFVDRSALVVLPAIFVALATMPRRPRKCNRARAFIGSVSGSCALGSFPVCKGGFVVEPGISHLRTGVYPGEQGSGALRRLGGRAAFSVCPDNQPATGLGRSAATLPAMSAPAQPASAHGPPLVQPA